MHPDISTLMRVSLRGMGGRAEGVWGGGNNPGQQRAEVSTPTMEQSHPSTNHKLVAEASDLKPDSSNYSRSQSPLTMQEGGRREGAREGGALMIACLSHLTIGDVFLPRGEGGMRA